MLDVTWISQFGTFVLLVNFLRAQPCNSNNDNDTCINNKNGIQINKAIRLNKFIRPGQWSVKRYKPHTRQTVYCSNMKH